MLEKSVELSSPRDVGLSHEVLGNTRTGIPLTKGRDPLISGRPALSGTGALWERKEPT